MNEIYSAKLRRIVRGLKLQPADIAFADLIASGWKIGDAWFVVYKKGATWPAAQLEREQEAKYKTPAIQERIEDTRNFLTKKQLDKEKKKDAEQEEKSDKEILELAMSKKEMIKELYLIRQALKPGSADYLNVNKQIIDVALMKKEEVKTEDNTIHFYLPKKCHTCKYKNKEKE